MNKLRIAVVGVGFGGKTHIHHLKANNQARLDAIIAPDEFENYAIARNENVPIFNTIEECLKQRKIDAIIIASPNQFHVEHARVCINAGIPVLIEKPLTCNIHEGLELVNLTERRQAKVLVAHHRAHNPIIQVACQEIRNGRLGRIVSVMGSAQFYKPAHYFDDGPWRKEIGGGPILINLIHEIDNLRRLVGEIKEVQAVTSSSVRGFDVEDTAAINLVFDNGAIGTFILSDCAATPCSWEQTSGENPIYPSYPYQDCYLISGMRGSLGLPTMRLKYYPEKLTPSWWTPFAEETLQISKRDPVDCQLEHFVEIIRGEVNPLVTVRDGYHNVLVAEAIRESARIKSRVCIDI